jgi:DNA-binding transcriptional regulator of glucitol operon
MRQFAPFFAVFAALWVLQLYWTAKQGQHFMQQVGRLRPLGETAIGASSTSRLRRRSYVALASDETDLVTGAIELNGVTVFARAKDAPELVGRSLRELADAPDGERRENAARMAARVLLGEDLTPEQSDRTVTGKATAGSESAGADLRSHLPSATGTTTVREQRERGS